MSPDFETAELRASALRSQGAAVPAPMDHEDPIIACATDDGYVMPLAVTLLTAARHLRAGSRIRLFVLDGGISQENRRKLEESWRNEPIDVEWIVPDRELVADLVTSHHISSVAYYRILLPHVLPAEIERVIYLDCDLLVKGDLLEIWELELNDWWCMAVPDIACPYIDARQGMPNFRKASPYLASLKPVANYSDFDISPRSKYFNSGVLYINLSAWRQQQLAERMLDCLRRHEKHVWCWDQYALNAILSGHWLELPLRWNFGTHAFEFPSESHLPVDLGEYLLSCRCPSIVHFTTEFKPWHFGTTHPFRDDFYRYLDQTAWRDWRPMKRPFQFQRWWNRNALHVQKQALISYRKLAAVGHRESL